MRCVHIRLSIASTHPLQKHDGGELTGEEQSEKRNILVEHLGLTEDVIRVLLDMPRATA